METTNRTKAEQELIKRFIETLEERYNENEYDDIIITYVSYSHEEINDIRRENDVEYDEAEDMAQIGCGLCRTKNDRKFAEALIAGLNINTLYNICKEDDVYEYNVYIENNRVESIINTLKTILKY